MRSSPVAIGSGLAFAIPNPATDKYGTIDCQPSPGPYYDWATVGLCAGVCGEIGDDPCVEAIEPSTWGAIKALVD